MHIVFAGLIRNLGDNYAAEVTYLDHNLASAYNAFGSSRADGVYGPRESPSIAVDARTGNARITSRQRLRYERNLPLGTRLYQIVIPP